VIRPFRDELDALYRSVLGRPVDHSGYFTYASLLETGTATLEDIERILRDSSEGREHAATGGIRD
jgi:hypothetical protein